MKTVGATNLRYADLIAGSLPNGSQVFATFLTYPFTAEGQSLPAAQRPNILGRVVDVVDPISSDAITVSQASLQNSTQVSKLVRFTAAFLAANRFLNDPANKACSVSAIAAQLNITTDVAEQEYTAATDPDTGEVSPGGNFTVNQEGLSNIIAVRQEFGGFASLPAGFNFTAASQPGPGKLIDYSIRDAAEDASLQECLEAKLASLQCN